ncbi:CDGSH iron-sulfur domain-containing protein [Methanosarcina barkeri]
MCRWQPVRIPKQSNPLRCGKSENKPYCDGSHWMTSQQKLEFRKKWGLK